VDISAVDTYSGVEVCTPIFLGEARNHVGSKSFFKKFQNSIRHIPEQSSIQTRVAMWKNIGLW
jgi:hypothetical protein